MSGSTLLVVVVGIGVAALLAHLLDRETAHEQEALGARWSSPTKEKAFRK